MYLFGQSEGQLIANCPQKKKSNRLYIKRPRRGEADACLMMREMAWNGSRKQHPMEGSNVKQTAFLAALLSLVIILLLSPAAALAQSEGATARAEASVNSGLSTADIYNKMIALFIIGERTDNFDSAMEIYETYKNSLSLQFYQDAEKYYRYMQARQYLAKGNYADAAVIFQSLDDFNDSPLYAAYASGRIAEAEGRFGDAVNHYIAAANLNKRSGVGSDVVERMLDCNKRISDEQKSVQYKAALIDYEAARGSGDAVRVAEVLKVFTALAGYQDADTYAQACTELLKNLTRKISISASTNAASAFISWTDTAAAAEKAQSGSFRYTVLWKPSNCKQASMQTNCVSPVTLTGLIPGTEYEITVLDAESDRVSATITVSVPSSQIYPREKIKFNRMEIAGIESATLELEYTGANGNKEKITPLTIFQMWDSFLIRQPDNGFTVSDLNDCVLYGGVVFTNLTAQEMNVGLQVVLRSSAMGTYQTEAGTYHLLAEAQPQMLCVNISDALQKLQDEYFSLAAGQYGIEIYMDGQFLCNSSIWIR